jgi:hypothetical protein
MISDKIASISLERSTDGLRTWQAIDAPIRAASESPSTFWVNPSDGHLLAEGDAGYAGSLWASLDQGTTWTKLGDSGMRAYAIQYPVLGQPWHICGMRYTSPPDAAPVNFFKCSTDGGHTWSDMPGLEFTLHCDTCDNGQPVTRMAGANVLGFAGDGSLLVTIAARLDVAGNTVTSVYKLAPGAAKWQSLGETPASVQVAVFPWLGRTLWSIGGPDTYVASYT